MEQDQYINPAPIGPMFNIITGHFYFNALAKGPRMAEAFVGGIRKRSDGTHDMTEVFERTVIAPDGTPGGFVLNHKSMALLDFYITTSIFGGIPAAAEFREIFALRCKQYQAANGEGGARDMRAELKSVLEGYLDQFPHTVEQVRKARTSARSIPVATTTTIDLTAEELNEFTAGPAGGAEPVRISNAGAATPVRPAVGAAAASEGVGGAEAAAAGGTGQES